MTARVSKTDGAVPKSRRVASLPLTFLLLTTLLPSGVARGWAQAVPDTRECVLTDFSASLAEDVAADADVSVADVNGDEPVVRAVQNSLIRLDRVHPITQFGVAQCQLVLLQDLLGRVGRHAGGVDRPLRSITTDPAVPLL